MFALLAYVVIISAFGLAVLGAVASTHVHHLHSRRT